MRFLDEHHEEAIKEINRTIQLVNRWYADLVPESTEALEMAIEALRKQESVKPKACHIEPMYQGLYYQGQVRTKAAGTNKWHFCPNCGEKIDWEDEA